MTREEALIEAKKRGLVAQDYKPQLSQEEAMKLAMDKGLIKPREDGAGFLTRSKFSFADSDAGRKQVLEDNYGKGNALKLGDRWLVKDKKGWNYVDEKGLSWSDLADFSGDIPEMIGGGVGATVGAIAGTPFVGGSIGAGVGSGAGRYLKKEFADKVLGIDNKQNTDEVLSDVQESGLWGAGGNAVGHSLGTLINKALNPLAKSWKGKDIISEDAFARQEIANKHGVKLTPAQMMQSKGLMQLENGLKNHYASVDDITKWIDEQQIKPFNQAIANNTTQKSNDAIGDSIQGSIQRTQKANKNMFNQEYRDLANQVSGDIPTSSLNGVAMDILEANKDLPKELKDGAVGVANSIIEMPTDAISYNQLMKMRTNLGDKALSGQMTGDVGSAQYKRLKSALDEDFNNYALYNGIGGQKQEIDEAYKVYKDLYNNNNVKSIAGTPMKEAIPSETVIDKVVVAKEPSRLETITRASNNPEAVKDAVVNKVLNESRVMDNASPEFGANIIAPSRLATQTNKYGEHLTNVGANQLKELGTVGGLLKTSDEFLNGSKTASNMTANSGMGLITAIPQRMKSKVYTSDKGQKWLTTGLGTFDKNKSLGRYGAMIGAMINE